MRWVRQNRIDDELAREIASHIAERVDDLVDAGMNLQEARQKAKRDFGNSVLYLEKSREVWSARWLEQLQQDVRYALRTFRRSPVFTAVVVLSLALGIGANSAIFSLMDAVMWRTLPVKDPQSLWVPHFVQPAAAPGFLFKYSAVGNEFFFNYGQYRTMRDGISSAEIAAYSAVRLNVSVDGRMEPAAEGQRVSGNYFSLLGVEPIVGRAITVEDDRVPNGRAVAVISYDYWDRRFELNSSAIGSTISLSGTPFTIVGVTPPEFFGLDVGTAPDIFVPVAMQPTVTPTVPSGIEGSGTGRAWLQLVARLKSGADPQRTSADLQAFYSQSAANSANAARKLELSPAATGISGLRLQFSQALFVLMAVVGIVLLIACANIANLLLARAASRRPEFAMRLALGAGRRRIVRQLLVESVLLAAVGGVCGGLLARAATHLLVVYMSAGRAPIVLDLSPDLRVLGFTAAVSIFTALLFGLAPALRATYIDLTPALKNVTKMRGGRHSLRPGKMLTVVQVALSMILLVGAGLFVRSLQNLNSQDAGFPRESVLMVRVEPKGSNQRNSRVAQRLDQTYADLLRRVKTIPGVRSASMGNVSPSKPESGARAGSLQSIEVSAQAVYPRYFETLGQTLVAGRDFNSKDLGMNSSPVCIVNESFVRLAFGEGDAIGKPCMTTDAPATDHKIVGVVKDSRYTHLRGATQPVVYQPYLQANTTRGQMILHVRLDGSADAVIPRIQEEVWKTDKEVPQFEVRTLAEEVNAVLIQDRLIAMLSSFFGGVALLLASVGLYGLFAFAVIQRTSELGIRMALGATRSSVVWMILREALQLVVVGILIGVPAVLLAGRLVSTRISALLFGLKITDPATIAFATLFLVTVAAVAAYFPARRASRVEPIVALRNE